MHFRPSLRKEGSNLCTLRLCRKWIFDENVCKQKQKTVIQLWNWNSSCESKFHSMTFWTLKVNAKSQDTGNPFWESISLNLLEKWAFNTFCPHFDYTPSSYDRRETERVLKWNIKWATVFDRQKSHQLCIGPLHCNTVLTLAPFSHPFPFPLIPLFGLAEENVTRTKCLTSIHVRFRRN